MAVGAAEAVAAVAAARGAARPEGADPGDSPVEHAEAAPAAPVGARAGCLRPRRGLDLRRPELGAHPRRRRPGGVRAGDGVRPAPTEAPPPVGRTGPSEREPMRPPSLPKIPHPGTGAVPTGSLGPVSHRPGCRRAIHLDPSHPGTGGRGPHGPVRLPKIKEPA